MAHADTNLPGGIYCRHCGYDLRAQTAPHRCPECGQTFDPADRKTFLSRPPRGPAWRWARRVAVLLLSLGLLLGMGWGWLYWGWKSEQMTLAKLSVDLVKEEPLGGEKLKSYLGSAGLVLDRARFLALSEATDADIMSLKNLKELQWLFLGGTTDAELIHIKELKGLQQLGLIDAQISNTGLVHLKGIKGLQMLSIDGSNITDAGLVHLKELNNLEQIDLYHTKVTAAGIAELKAALPNTDISGP